MKRTAIVAVTAAALVGAGAAGAVAVGRVIYAANGDRVVVNPKLNCYVARTSISCGGASRAKLAAEIKSNGQIVILAVPDRRGAIPKLVVKRATCSATTGACRLVTSRP